MTYSRCRLSTLWWLLLLVLFFVVHIHSVVALIDQQLAMQISYVNKSKCWMSLVEEATGNWSLRTENWAQSMRFTLRVFLFQTFYDMRIEFYWLFVAELHYFDIKF